MCSSDILKIPILPATFQSRSSMRYRASNGAHCRWFVIEFEFLGLPIKPEGNATYSHHGGKTRKIFFKSPCSINQHKVTNLQCFFGKSKLLSAKCFIASFNDFKHGFIFYCQ